MFGQQDIAEIFAVSTVVLHLEFDILEVAIIVECPNFCYSGTWAFKLHKRKNHPKVLVRENHLRSIHSETD